MKQRSQVFQLDTVPYPAAVLVSIGQTDTQFKKTVEKFVGEPEISKKKHKNFEKSHEDTEAYILHFNTGHVVLRMYGQKWNAEGLAILQHEIYHVVHAVLRHAGIRPTLGTEEAYAYLTQHITEQIYNKILND